MQKHYLNELKHIDEKYQHELNNQIDYNEREKIIKNISNEKEHLEENFNRTTKILCNAYDKWVLDLS